jgi:hypothetical protein
MPTVEKNVGSTRTITSVQKKRRVISVAYDYDAGVYHRVITYCECEMDGSDNVVNTANYTVSFKDADLSAADKARIDAEFTAALDAI